MLVLRVKKNDIVAMQTLYNDFSKAMMATSLRITNNEADSEDILQDAFVTSFQKIAQLKEASKYGGWLKQIVINQSLNQVRKNRSFVNLDQIPELSDEDGNENDIPEGITFQDIKAVIHNLPDGAREVFSLYLLEDLKHREIAEKLNIAVSTSKSQYRYALKLLREKLIPAHE